jgi:hypothetical protein
MIASYAFSIAAWAITYVDGAGGKNSSLSGSLEPGLGCLVRPPRQHVGVESGPAVLFVATAFEA